MFACPQSLKCLNRILIDKSASLLYFTHYFCSTVNWNEDLTTATKHVIEDQWREYVRAASFEKNSSKPKYYVLSMFPYPSGTLHMGHARVYTISDTMARFHRMNGKNVLHPMGWDAFGLPAENAAMDRGIHPAEWTRQNITHMSEQLRTLGCSFDWDRELATCEPEYYRWTQFLFLKMYDAGLVYRKESLVNWDPVDQTVLADEQVDANGCSWRSGAKVEKKLLKQWFIRTTHFSKSLLDGLSDPLLRNWRDIIKLQSHWIGECDGTNFEFELENTSDGNISESDIKTLTVWTRRPELIPKASFIAVAPGSVLDLMDKGNGERKLATRARNAFTGEFLPIFVTDQIPYEQGAENHLGVPEVSEHDQAFAVAAGLPARPMEVERKWTCEGGFPTSAKLRDWLVSRQRYWGTPIPMVHCDCCGVQPVPISCLPVLLPNVDWSPSKSKSALLDDETWIFTKCPKCGGEARRETDTMDTFVDSAWYYLRFLDPHNTERPFELEDAARFMPVDLYIGGKEHAVLHLYYARFLTHFLNRAGLLPHREPFQRLLVQGLIMGRTYLLESSGRYLRPEDVDLSGPNPVDRDTRQPVVVSWEKMSKSKHNGVAPADMFEQYGTDTTRLLVLADVAPTSQRNWSADTFPGILKWQRRLWMTMQSFLSARHSLDPSAASAVQDTPKFREHEAKLCDSRNYYLKGVTFNYEETFQLSVAISKMQGLTNSLRRAPADVVAFGSQFERALATQIVMLAPMAPHFASQLWSGFVSAPHRINTLAGHLQWDLGVLQQSWPQLDEDYHLELVCNVNGFENCSLPLLRHSLDSLTHEEALKLALAQVGVQKRMTKHKIVNTVFTLHPGYQATINIITEKVEKKKKLMQEA